MKVCVVGPGAVGGQIAAAFAQAGATTCVLARGAHLDAIQNSGLKVEFPDRQLDVKLRASDDAKTLGVQDVVFLTVKATALRQAVAQMRPLIGNETEVVAVMNGVPWWFMADQVKPLLDPDGSITATIERTRLIGGVVYTASHVAGPGRIVVTTPRRRLILGLTPGAKSVHAAAIAAALESQDFPVKLSDNIGVDLWTKLIANLGCNLVATVRRGTLQQTFADEGNFAVAKRIIGEAKDIASVTGYSLKVDADRLIADSARLPHRPSTLQDLEAGRAIEIDAMFRAPLELARRASVSAPTLIEWVGKLEAQINDRR